MARITASVYTSHVPAIGAAMDLGKTQEPYWQKVFAGYDFYGYLARTARLRSGVVGAGFRALSPALDWTARRGAAFGRACVLSATSGGTEM